MPAVVSVADPELVALPPPARALPFEGQSTYQHEFVAKRGETAQVAYVPVLGWVTWLSGAIFVNRGDRDKAIRSMKRAVDRVRAGLSVAAFVLFSLAWSAALLRRLYSTPG